MKNITIGKYIPGNSFIHKLDPRIKFVLMTAFIFLVFSANNYHSLGFASLFTFIIFVNSRLGFKRIFSMLKPFRFMFIFLLVINLLMWKEGTIISEIFGLTEIFGKNIREMNLYWDAIHRTLLILSRIVLMIMVSTVLTSTTKPIDLTIALEKILKPYLFIGSIMISIYVSYFVLEYGYTDLLLYLIIGVGFMMGGLILWKFPIMEIAMMISLALRFIPTLLEETDKIMKAQASRGADFENGKFREKIYSMITLIIPLFASAFQKAAELSDAMDSRGYVVGARRTRYRVLQLSVRDFVGVALVFGSIYVVLWSQTLSRSLV